MEHHLKKIFLLLKNRSFVILTLLSFFALFASHIPKPIHQGLYTISLFIKDIMLFILPIAVGSFIAKTIVSFEKKAPLFIASLLVFEALSNFSGVIYAFFSGSFAQHFTPAFQVDSNQQTLDALWRLPSFRPAFWTADKGTLLGFILGIGALIFKSKPLNQFIDTWKDISNFTLTKVFSPLIPLFILGFFAKMFQSGFFIHLFSKYGTLLVLMLSFLGLYLTFLFWLSSDGTLKSFRATAKNLLPAGGIAFTSGCSLSTMPWTIKGASQNLKDPSFASAVIPATTNIQQIGDVIINTFLCFLLVTHFHGAPPSFLNWIIFSCVFVLARFTVAAVLGGAILIMIPIYESYLGFSPEMVAIILAFNVVLDPIVTASNVLANGALCRVYEKVWIKIQNSFSKKETFEENP
jgi:Na+/H+-dicarboxylate symporter